jgi:hypothetical protein
MPIHLLPVLCAFVYSHGFLYAPGPLSDSQANPSVRDYAAVSYAIDELRNPVATQNGDAFVSKASCRYTFRGKRVPIQLSNGADFAVTMAFSVGAQHIGPCIVQIMEDGNPASAVTISPRESCARPPLAQFDTVKESAASQCPGKIPKGLVTDDMCLHEWRFKLSNVDKIKCKNCVLRWAWSAEHMMPAREEFESCVDVEIGQPAPVVRDLELSDIQGTTIQDCNSITESNSVIVETDCRNLFLKYQNEDCY